jgi:hypothetical protein
MSGPLFYHASMATQPYTTTPPPEISLGGIITSNKAGPKKKGAPLVDNNDDGSCAYDLESLAIDARGWDDGKEAIEVGRTASFGYAEATRGDNRRRKKLSSAEEANAVPRSDRRKSRVIGGGGFSDRGGRSHDFGMPRLADVGRRQ